MIPSGGAFGQNHRFECEMTILAGEVVWDLNARDGTAYGEILSSVKAFGKASFLFLRSR